MHSQCEPLTARLLFTRLPSSLHAFDPLLTARPLHKQRRPRGESCRQTRHGVHLRLVGTALARPGRRLGDGLVDVLFTEA